MKKVFYISTLVLSLLAFAPWGFAQNNSRMDEVSQALDRDILLSFPTAVVIEAVNLRDATVRIDGHSYKLVDSLTLPSTETAQLSLSELQPGMEVMIQTDGIEPSNRDVPHILRIWKQ